MKTAPAASSLSELRAKTDRQLAILVRRELNRCRGLIHAARLEDAERSLATAKTLLDVAEISGKERARLEEEVDEVRSALARCAMPAA